MEFEDIWIKIDPKKFIPYDGKETSLAALIEGEWKAAIIYEGMSKRCKGREAAKEFIVLSRNKLELLKEMRAEYFIVTGIKIERPKCQLYSPTVENLREMYLYEKSVAEIYQQNTEVCELAESAAALLKNLITAGI